MLNAAVESYKHWPFATIAGFGKCVSISAVMRSSMHRPCMAGSPMNMKDQNKRILLRSALSAPRWAFGAMLLAATTAVCFAQGTREQRLACTPDVLRLCSAFIPNADIDEITTCLRAKTDELSDACRPAIDTGIKQLPSANGSTGAPARTTR